MMMMMPTMEEHLDSDRVNYLIWRYVARDALVLVPGTKQLPLANHSAVEQVSTRIEYALNQLALMAPIYES